MSDQITRQDWFIKEFMNQTQRSQLRELLKSDAHWVAFEVVRYIYRMRNKFDFNQPLSCLDPLPYFETLKLQILTWGAKCADHYVLPVPRESVRKIEEGLQEMINWVGEMHEVSKAEGGHSETS